MLNTLRRYHRSAAIKVLYVMIVASFVIWGVGTVGSERVDVVATVWDEPISRRELDETTVNLQRRYEAIFRGATLPAALDLRSRALDELIDDSLLRHEARRLGLDVSDDEVVDEITTMPEFQENGRFNRAIVEQVLQVQRDRGEFEDQIRRGILRERLQALVTDGVTVGDAELEEKYRLEHEQADLRFVRIAAAELAKSVTPDDAELQKYLDEHPDRYRVPTKVRARYMVYRPHDFAAQVNPTDTDVTQYYEQHRDDRFTQVEQVRARHVLVKLSPGADDEAKAAARKKAEDVLAKAKGGADFADLAKTVSEDTGSAASGGDLGLFPRGRMVPAFDDVAFSLEPGSLSEVVETSFGFHVIKVEEKRAAGPRPLEEVRGEIVDLLKAERGLDMARVQAEADRRTIVHGKSFRDAFGDRPIQETPPFAERDVVPGIAASQGFVKAAFTLDEGQVSDLVETDDALYLLAPFGRVDAHPPALADVRDRVLADAQRARGEVLAKERADEVMARTKEVGLEPAATEARLTVDTTGLFERRAGAVPKLAGATDLRTDAFTLTTEAPLGKKVYVVGGDAVVVALRERVPADMTGFAAAKDGLRDTALQQKRYAVLTQFMNLLKERAQRAGALEVGADVLERG